MNWKDRAIDDLKLLGVREQSVGCLRAQIAVVEADIVCLPSKAGGGVPVKGGGNRQEQRLCAYIDRKDKLVAKAGAMLALVKQTERALAALGKTERAVLNAFFCEGRRPGEAVRELEETLHVSRSEVYRLRERALWLFAGMMGYL